MKLEAVIYLRSASKSQATNGSLDTQEKICRRFADENDLIVNDVFADIGAGRLKNVGLTKMLSYLAESTTKPVVIISDLARLSRNPAINACIRSEIADRGADIIVYEKRRCSQ